MVADQCILSARVVGQPQRQPVFTSLLLAETQDGYVNLMDFALFLGKTI